MDVPRKPSRTLPRPCASVRAIRWHTSGSLIGGSAKRHLGIWEEAVAWFRRSIEANRNFPESHFELAAALAELGRLDDARSAVRSGLVLDPNFSVARARAFFTAENSDPKYLAQMDHILEGLRKAGVPEG